jgi:NAD(P)-dependent dehydrogenase (short-subunit alcohol dehydrogenase family)
MRGISIIGFTVNEKIVNTTSKVALVSGTSSGFGQATSALLAAQGFRVFGTSRTPTASGSSYEMLSLDVRSDLSVQECIETVLQRAGRIDLLVNNAGYALGGALEENTVSDAQAQFDTNVFGALRLINAVLPTMRRQMGGQIISVSSLLGVVALPYLTLYSSSKFALEGMMEGLRSEVRPFNITVSLVEPAFFKTNFAVQAPARPLADYAPFRELVLQDVSRAVEQGPDPKQVARAILRVATTPRPRLRYRVGPRANLLVGLRQLLPASVFEGMYRRIFHLDARVTPTPSS